MPTYATGVFSLCLHTQSHTHEAVCAPPSPPCVTRPPTDLLDEGVRSVGAQQQDGPAQRVPVAVQLLGPHGGEEVGEDLADVAVHPLQGHVHPLPGGLVQEALQAADIWGEEGGGGYRLKGQISANSTE